MEIKPAEGLKIKYKESVLNISRPTVSYLRQFKKRLRDASAESADETEIDVMWDYCLKVGVSEDILNQWTLSEMKQLFNFLNEDEKKS